MDEIKVFLVDDQKLFVDNLRTVLELTTTDIRVVGVAYDGREALDGIRDAMPDIVLMDVRMPLMDGVEATREIRANAWPIRILMLTTFDNDDYVHDALRAGADGYLLKSIPPDELFESIRAMRSGGVLISPGIARRVAGFYQHPSLDGGLGEAEEAAGASRAFAALTPRESEIVRMIAMAYTNREIAEQMFITEQTVKNYISRVYAKVGVSRRSQLMRLFSRINKVG